MEKLSKIIGIDEKKCVNCHKCIAVCPVKFCNDGSKDHVSINENLCVGCGNCLTACTHGARYIIDDFEDFLDGLMKKEKSIAFVAPSVAVHFPEEYLKFNGWLESLGIDAIFDVSFGAELTVKSYINHILKNRPKTVISQPCPAIVTYIQIYKPQLIKYLAPVHSPMLHAIKMVKNFYPEYKNHKIAVISPCIAKKREFEETGFGDYNLTFESIINYIDEKKIKISAFKETEYSNPPAERAVVFSTPGGLLETALREVKDINKKTRKIEGTSVIYDYLESFSEAIEKNVQPLLVDCLNCEKGCNGGTATKTKNLPADILEATINKRKETAVSKYSSKNIFDKNRLKKTINDHWKDDIYNRSYKVLSDNDNIKIPDKDRLKKIYESMEKFEEKDFYNCNSCGYESCENMAIAIFNGLNKSENCHYYKHAQIEKQHQKSLAVKDTVAVEMTKILSTTMNITSFFANVISMIEHQSAMVSELTASIEEILSTITSINNAVKDKITMTKGVAEKSKNGESEINKLLQSIGEISSIASLIRDAIKSINDLADKTNLLSMNASIEAAHAGEYGKGFAVVASEIRKLSSLTETNSKHIAKSLADITGKVDATFESTKKSKEYITGALKNTLETARSMEEVIFGISGIYSESNQITDSVNNLLEMTQNVRASALEMGEKIKVIENSIKEINEICK